MQSTFALNKTQKRVSDNDEEWQRPVSKHLSWVKQLVPLQIHLCLSSLLSGRPSAAHSSLSSLYNSHNNNPNNPWHYWYRESKMIIITTTTTTLALTVHNGS